jgi:sialate O-acetylesterase
MKTHENKTMGIRTAGFLIAMIILSSFTANADGQDRLVRVKDLNGMWKFSIGEREEWTSTNYDDSEWESIKVPAPWEEQGFYGYNGFATYRNTFVLSEDLRDRTLYLILGYVDDVDETFINGKKVGSTGSMPPSYVTAYNAKRKYYLPKEYLNFGGKNTITVKVYDSYQAGGIVSGSVGIYASENDMDLDINLLGTWKFRTGDDLARKNVNYNDSQWDKIFVPGRWEDQGYRDYDGYAWYRKSFVYNKPIDDEKVVLVLGKVDDLDQVYINGVLVGSTGTFTSNPGQALQTELQYQAFRGYYIPVSLLKKGENTIAVRIFDGQGEGGIYEGPVGILSQKKYIAYWRNKASTY